MKLVLREWEELAPLPGNVLHGLQLHDPSRVLAQQLSARGMLDIEELRTGIRIRATSYVGRIDIGPLSITVQPKLEGVRLLKLVRYAYGLRDLTFLSDAEYGTRFDSFQDLLIYQLASDSAELLRRGLRRQYRDRNEWLARPRGRLDFGQIAGRSVDSLATLPCSHHPRALDWLPNQLLLSGLRLGARLASDMMLRTTVRRLATQLEDDVSPIPLALATFARWRQTRNRLVSAYDGIVQVTALLARSAGISLQDDAQIRLPGCLFDMNRFFQSLLSRFLRENLSGAEVVDEHGLKGMMAYTPGFKPPGRNAPTPRPDFAITRNGKVVLLLDAKYRDLWNKGLPRDMLYQLAVYALSGEGCDESVILYPTVGTEARESRLEIRNSVRGVRRAIVVERPVDLERLANLVQLGADECERAEYARALVRSCLTPQ